MAITSRSYSLFARIFDLLKGVISLALIAAILVGVPIALILIAGFPFPTETPSIDLMRAHIEDGNIPDSFVIKTLAVVVWVVWVQLVFAMLAEVFALIRGRVAGRTPIMPGLQLFAGKLVGSTVLIVSALTPSRSVAAVPIVPLESAALSALAPTAAPADGLVLGALGDFTGPTVPSVDPGDAANSPTSNPAGQYATKAGDNWWDMAERLLDDGMRWSELRGMNLGRTMATGETISEQTEIVSPGWHLNVPADADSDLLSPASADESAGADESSGEGKTAGEGDTAEDEAETADDEVDSPVMARARATVDYATLGRPDILTYEGPTGVVDQGTLVPYQVVAGDNLWDIAERHLGDPFRWPEIFEHSTGLEQSFGRQITDPNLIWPESILQLPSDATDVPPPSEQLVRDVVGASPMTEAVDEQSTEIQPEDLQSVTNAAKQAVANGPVVATTGRIEEVATEEVATGHVAAQENPVVDEDLAAKDDLAIASPVQADSADPNPNPNSKPNPDPNPEPESSGSGPESSDEDADEQPQPSTVPAALSFGAGGVLVASGMLGMLHRARRLRLCEAAEQQQPARPPLELVDIETVLRNSADTPRARSVYTAIRSLANRPVVVGEPVATPEVIRISRDRVEVVQRGLDSNLPSPWLVGKSPALEFLADRSLAVLSAERFSDEPAQGPVDTPAPVCVTIGGGLILNLEAVGLLGISGSTEQAAGLVRSMVHELATGPGRRSIDIRVSRWLPGAELHQHVQCGPLDNLAEELGSWLEAVELASAAAGGLNAYGMRLARASSPHLRSTVVFADQAEAEMLQPLVERARRRSLPLALVVAGQEIDPELGCEAVIRLEARTLKLMPHGFTAATQFLDVEVLEGTRRLIDHARTAAMVRRADDELTGLAGLDLDTDPAQLPTEETPEHEIVTELPTEEHEITDQGDDAKDGLLVRVLGSVEIEGAPADLSDSDRSLITFLALVGPSTGEQIRDAIWPANTVGEAEFAATVERLRGLLGDQFPDLGDGRYRLRSVTTDLGSARRWIGRAKSISDERARSLLQLALAEVRGEPFSDVGERHWQWIADHKLALATQASAMLIDACFDLCDNAYAADEIHLAKWACDVGALIDPLHETVLTRRIQLLQILGQTAEASQILETWEGLYEAAAGRPAPRGARVALQTAREIAPHVG